MVDADTKARIMQAAKIEDVVGKYVNLKRSGSSLKGLCPFHDEKTPSFVVTPAKNICKCFGCGGGGTPVSFLMNLRKCQYEDAMRELAEMYGIEWKERVMTDEDRQRVRKEDTMRKINQFALDFFVKSLWDTEEGRNIGLSYFRERGLRDETIRDFKLGYCPRGSSLAKAAAEAGYPTELLLELGLCKQGEHGIYDFFGKRVIFPIFSISNTPVAFGARILGALNEKSMKYLNSPDSLIYHKGREVFGLSHAATAIARLHKCIVVEGYLDVISMHQAGLRNVVASSGTAFTKDQIYQLKRMSDNLLLMFDCDKAGRDATTANLKDCLEAGMNVKVMMWPESEGKVDPDMLAQTHELTEIEAFINKYTVDAMTYLHSGVKGADDADVVARKLDDALANIVVVSNPVLRELLLKKCSELYAIPLKTMYARFRQVLVRYRKENEVKVEDTVRENPVVTGPLEEVDLLRYMIYHGNSPVTVEDAEGNKLEMAVIDYVDASLKDDGMWFSTELHRKVADEILACQTVDVCRELGYSHDEDVQRFVASLNELAPEQVANLSQIVERAIFQLKSRDCAQRIDELMKALDASVRAKDGEAGRIAAEIKRMKEMQTVLNKRIGRPI